MEIGIGSYGFGFLAGVLSTLSPCVLPILPILLSSATATHPRAPLVLASGLALSYAVIGTLIAWLGAEIGLEAPIFRAGGAVILGVFGLVLLSVRFQERFGSATSAVAAAGNHLISTLNLNGLTGQFVIGLALGVIWSPCVGPTLGGAIVLASQGEHLLQVAFLMIVFGLGAAFPVIALSYLSRSAMTKVRGKLLQTGKYGKTILGLTMVTISIVILSGVDKPIETWLVQISPSWLTVLTTSY